MTSATRNDVASMVPNLAQANRKVLLVVERLATRADEVEDEATRSLLLGAAQDLLGATNEINDTLATVAGGSASVSKRP